MARVQRWYSVEQLLEATSQSVACFRSPQEEWEVPFSRHLPRRDWDASISTEALRHVKYWGPTSNSSRHTAQSMNYHMSPFSHRKTSHKSRGPGEPRTEQSQSSQAIGARSNPGWSTGERVRWHATYLWWPSTSRSSLVH